MNLTNFKVSSEIKYDFHVSKEARVKYKFDSSLFSISGNLIVANFYQARVLSEKINSIRKAEHDSMLVTAGQINGLGLLHEIFHYVLRYYEEKENPGVFFKGISHLQKTLGDSELNKVLLEYINDFPPLDVFNGKVLAEDYLTGSTGKKPNREIILEELILLNLENDNPALSSLEELYSDKPLAKRTKYTDLLFETEKFFVTEKPIGPENLPLTEFLRKPIKNNPYNIEGQLDYILNVWGVYVFSKFYDRILGGKDLIHEDYKLFIPHGGGEKASPPVPQYKYDAAFFERLKRKIALGEQLTLDESQFYYSETEQFTEDIDWMPKVVMIAKNTYVWLDQLSKNYQREIRQLDQIPDEELDRLARWNFTALWLIGIWERSSASKKVKHLTGNIDAVSSAYSLYDYVIAQELGGEDAFQNLKDRCWQRGIRLSSDMVPNHTGIYSKWVTEKPGYFIQTDYPPYPGYTFNGPNLSDDPRVEVRIEDKYYNRSDAAVVFQRKDAYTSDTKYIYHGNDGTHMPWNDTAQLNLLIPEVRESLIQTIMHVARKTPIIRFDAAMTLAKKHFQRLWFPQPGTGGAVPSRSDHAMTRTRFDEAMPVEFWREVVDRINAEMPQTLLLAEAFWLMESYFVRTLGMHRVYNSAFMHMMMKEENDKYREILRNTLEFNPEILKRYVNFMSNPDEETAVNQFGKGDKYFGICVMLLTMPGLPMFAHGQIEGFAEKYGMEYKRAYYDEFVDNHLVQRHEKEIFPLAQRRHIFSQVYNFELYDFLDNSGSINENVFAFSNRSADEKTLVIYNNCYEECTGTLNFSVQKNSGSGNLYNNKLGDALSIKNDPMFFYVCREHRSGMEYIINGKDIHEFGLYIPLSGYEYRVYLDFREIFDTTGDYRGAYNGLMGNGVPSIERYLQEMQLAGVHNCARELLSFESFEMFNSYTFNNAAGDKERAKGQLTNLVGDFLTEFNNISSIPVDKDIVLNTIKDELEAVKELTKVLTANMEKKRKPVWIETSHGLPKIISNGKLTRDMLYPIIIFKNLSSGWVTLNPGENRNVFDKLLIDDLLYRSLEMRYHASAEVSSAVGLIKTLSISESVFNSGRVLLKQVFPDESRSIKKATSAKKVKKTREEYFLEKLLQVNNDVNFLNVNDYNGNTYYHKENFETLIDWVYLISIIEEANKYLVQRGNSVPAASASKKPVTPESLEKDFIAVIKKENQFFANIKLLSEKSGYEINKLLKLAAAKPEKKNQEKEKMINLRKNEPPKNARARKNETANAKKKNK